MSRQIVNPLTASKYYQWHLSEPTKMELYMKLLFLNVVLQRSIKLLNYLLEKFIAARFKQIPSKLFYLKIYLNKIA